MRHRIPVVALTCVVLILVACAPPQAPSRIESPQQAANRILSTILAEEPDPEYPAPYGPDAVAGEPKAMLDDYVPSRVPVAWILQNDLRVPAGRLFASMEPAPASKTWYAVPILQDGEPVSEFEIGFEAGKWTEGSRLAETEPAGYFHDIRDTERALAAELGAGAQTRVALFLPSGLVFVVGNNGSTELAAYLAFQNGGPGITGYNKYLPQTGDLYDAEELRGLLDPRGPSPEPVDQ